MLPIVLIAATMSALPQLNIERVCRGAGAGMAEDEYKTCVESEHSALAALQQKWAQYPAKVRNECAHVVRVAPESSYAELQTCIESQTGDRGNLGSAPAK
jgi:hypothetical protein